MEAAAEAIRQLTRTTLPERPHQLAQSPDWKSQHYPDDSQRPEEWRDTRLQYMTMVTDADRGVLFARGYYDIRPEPPRPKPRDVNVLSRVGAKKLSLSDYNKKKTAAASSVSPPDSTAKSMNSPASVLRLEPKDTLNDSVPKKSLPQKPSSLPPRPPTSDKERRKRLADDDDTGRPPKRPKPADLAGRPIDDRSQTPRDDARSRKVHDHQAVRDLKDSRPGNLSSRANPLNGVRPNATESMRSAPSKAGAVSKHFVPPLLSPLRLDIDGNREDLASGRADRRLREPDLSTGKTARPQNIVNSSKRSKSPLKLPPLLSPTLPLEIEEELERVKATPSQPSEARFKAEENAPFHAQKTRAEPPDESQDGKERKTHLVTLKLPKRLKARFSAYMRMEASTSRKAPRQDPPRGASGAAPLARAEKRPATYLAEPLPEPSAAVKRPRTSDVSSSSRMPMPSTPSKKGAQAMSRVSSNNSLAHTPGDVMAATPSGAGSSERTVSASGPPYKPTTAKIDAKVEVLKAKEAVLCSLGKRLKHNADQAMKGRMEQSAATNGNVKSSEPNIKLGYVLLLESTLAFAMGFHVQDTHRGLASKASDPNCSWATLLPLLEYLQKDMRRTDPRRPVPYPPIYAVSMVLQILAFDETLKAYATHENTSSLSVQEILKNPRRRDINVNQLREINKQIDGRLVMNVTLCSTVEEVAEMALRVIRRWCADEGIDYTEKLNLKEMGLKSTVHS